MQVLITGHLTHSTRQTHGDEDQVVDLVETVALARLEDTGEVEARAEAVRRDRQAWEVETQVEEVHQDRQAWAPRPTEHLGRGHPQR